MTSGRVLDGMTSYEEVHVQQSHVHLFWVLSIYDFRISRVITVFKCLLLSAQVSVGDADDPVTADVSIQLRVGFLVVLGVGNENMMEAMYHMYSR